MVESKSKCGYRDCENTPIPNFFWCDKHKKELENTFSNTEENEILKRKLKKAKKKAKTFKKYFFRIWNKYADLSDEYDTKPKNLIQ